MGTVRKTGGRNELDALWVQVEALIVDITAARSALLLGLDRGNNQVVGRDPATALVADLTAIRNALLAALDRGNNQLLGRSPLTALLADVADVRAKLAADIADVTALIRRHERSAVGWADVDAGSTAGKLKTTAAADYRIGGTLYNKAATDDLWDLSAEIDTAGDKYRAYYLYVDSGGTATFEAGTDEDSAELAIAALPGLPSTKSVIGVFVAGLACDFDNVAGLAGQGTIYNGFPTGYTQTASAPAAATATAANGIADGTTAGTLRTKADVEFQVAGKLYRKADTDDLWDLSAEVDTIADEYRAYWLYLDASGVATIAAGANAADAAAAIAALPAEVATKCPIGVYVAGPLTDFDGVAGLAAQGDIHDGRPAALADPAALGTSTAVAIDDGTTAGTLRTVADTEFQISGKLYRKASTDDLWDLSAEIDTIAAQYRAYWLYVDASGVATVAAGTDAASEAAALAALPAETATKCPVGVFVAGPETDFDDAGGLAAQGTIINGRPAATADPAAITATSTTLIHA